MHPVSYTHLDVYKRQVSVVPMAAPDQIVSVDISLKGFTEAYNALKAEMPVKKN